MTTRRRTAPSGIWSRTAKALGKIWAEVISLPDRGPGAARRNVPQDDCRFPIF